MTPDVCPECKTTPTTSWGFEIMDPGHDNGEQNTGDMALAMAALWGAVAGAVTSIVRIIQTPTTWSVARARMGLGILSSAAAAVIIYWRYPDIPHVVAILAAGGVGFLTAHMSESIMKLMDALSIRLGKTAKKFGDRLGLEKGEDTPAPSQPLLPKQPPPPYPTREDGI